MRWIGRRNIAVPRMQARGQASRERERNVLSGQLHGVLAIHSFDATDSTRGA
jgi:hypothetical protein